MLVLLIYRLTYAVSYFLHHFSFSFGVVPGLVQVKAYIHSQRFRLKFYRESVTLRGFLAVLLLSAEFQIEPLAFNAIYYCTSQKQSSTVPDLICASV